MSCLNGTGPPSGPQLPRARTAADAPPEKHPFHLFRPRTRVKITIKGYDTVSCDEVAANHFYYTQDGGIVEGRRFSDANTRASMANLEYGLQGKKQRLTSIFDYDRLDELV